VAIISNPDSPPHRNFHRPPPQVKFAADWVSRRRRFLCSVDPAPPLQYLRASNWGDPKAKELHLTPHRPGPRAPPRPAAHLRRLPPYTATPAVPSPGEHPIHPLFLLQQLLRHVDPFRDQNGVRCGAALRKAAAALVLPTPDLPGAQKPPRKFTRAASFLPGQAAPLFEPRAPDLVSSGRAPPRSRAPASPAAAPLTLLISGRPIHHGRPRLDRRIPSS